MRLLDEGTLQEYVSPELINLPHWAKDLQGYWAANAARARVIIINADLVSNPEEIDLLDDFLDPRWEGKGIGIAYPIFGTTATHAAALYSALGPAKAREYFTNLNKRGVRIVDGNSVVRDQVVSGAMAFGLTDTDDACGALARGANVVISLPDQGSLGTLVIPSAVSLITNVPHLEQGKALIDFLLSEETEQALLDLGFSHIPIHSDLQLHDTCLGEVTVQGMDVDYLQIYQYFDDVQMELREIFIK